MKELIMIVMLKVLLNSKLPMDILGRIWELSDLDKDGYLDRDEFALVRLDLCIESSLSSIFKFVTGLL